MVCRSARISACGSPIISAASGLGGESFGSISSPQSHRDHRGGAENFRSGHYRRSLLIAILRYGIEQQRKELAFDFFARRNRRPALQEWLIRSRPHAVAKDIDDSAAPRALALIFIRAVHHQRMME